MPAFSSLTTKTLVDDVEVLPPLANPHPPQLQRKNPVPFFYFKADSPVAVIVISVIPLSQSDCRACLNTKRPM